MNKVNLKKSVKIDGEDVSVIEYDFNKIKGKDIIDIFKDILSMGYPVTSYITDPVFLIRVFAAASNYDANDIGRINLVDNSKIVSLTRNYLVKNMNSVECDDNKLELIQEITIRDNNKDTITLKEVSYNFDELNGNDIENVLRELARKGYVPSTSYELDPICGVGLMARASKIDYEEFKKMGMIDFLRLSAITKDFFITSLNGFQEEEI